MANRVPEYPHPASRDSPATEFVKSKAFMYFSPHVPSPRRVRVAVASVWATTKCNEQISNFKAVRKYLFPIWLGTVPLFFLVLEVRKQVRRVSLAAAPSLTRVRDGETRQSAFVRETQAHGRIRVSVERGGRVP